MKIYAMYLMQKRGDTATVIDSDLDFSDIGYFYRRGALEICNFCAERLASAQTTEQFVSASGHNLLFHKMRTRDVVAIVVATHDYPSRGAFVILREIMHEYETCGRSFPNGQSSVIRRGIAQYQQPGNADKLTAIQENLEETREIMVQNLQKALPREESLEHMLENAENLSAHARAFARQSRNLSSCCPIITADLEQWH
jgi:synaptobrevin family protein YKT6